MDQEQTESLHFQLQKNKAQTHSSIISSKLKSKRSWNDQEFYLTNMKRSIKKVEDKILINNFEDEVNKIF